MARPTARVLALLEILQRGGVHPVSELASELGVDERTVRRYVDHLLELEMPVVGVRGRYGGYRLQAGERLPPLQLTDDEALAVMLGLVTAGRVGLVAADTAGEGAVEKIRRVLPDRTRRRLDAVLATTHLTGETPTAVGAEARVLLMMAEAARSLRPVWFEYTSHDGHNTSRTIHPYGIVAHNGRWYVTGHDTVSNEQRTFRLDRVRNPSLLPGSFHVPAGFNPRTAVLSSLAATPWRHQVVVRVQASADTLRARAPEGIASFEAIEPGWVRLRLRAERLEWVPALLAGLGADFIVEEPDELRVAVRALAERLLAGAR